MFEPKSENDSDENFAEILKSCKEDDLIVDVPIKDVPNGYKCKLCDVIYPQEWYLQLHLRTHANEKPYDCDFDGCNNSFATPGSLSEHKKITHERVISHVCSICEKEFNDKSDMLTHIENHDETGQTSEKFLPEHMWKLLQEVEMFVFDGQEVFSHSVCDKCGQIFDKRSEVAHHVRVGHNRTFKCQVKGCAKSFFAKSGLDSHSHIHKCTVCGKQFSNKSSMENHQIKHSDEKHFTCLECGRQFKRKEGLHLHAKKHAGIEDCHCDQCPAKYVSSTALAAHKLAKHTDPADKETFLCNFCGQSFNKREYLTKHVTIHTGEKPYQCKDCDKSFRSYGVYKNHLSVHRGIKDYKCNHCEQMFRQRQHLVVHERRHTGDKRHKCDECGKAFIEPATLRNHLKTHKN